MADSLPLYRIVYADGFVGAPRPWRETLVLWHWKLAAEPPACLAPVRVERVPVPGALTAPPARKAVCAVGGARVDKLVSSQPSWIGHGV